jgi:hypothetical protein
MSLKQETKKLILDKFVMLDWGEFAGFSDDFYLADLYALRGLIELEIDTFKEENNNE